MSDSKPKFNPNLPYQSAKPKFNPNQPFEASDDNPKVESNDPSPLESGVRKLVSSGSGGFSDELSGGLEALGTAAGVKGLGQDFGNQEMSDNGPTLDWEVLKHAYLKQRDSYRNKLKKDSEVNPKASAAGTIAGAIASPLNKIMPGNIVQQGATLGGIYGLGDSEADNVGDMAMDAGRGALIGGAVGKVADVAAPYIEKGANALGEKLGGYAEKLAVNATGATGKQSAKFSDDAGRELLDRGLVKFGDNAGNIADRTGAAMDEANAAIDSSLKALDSKGVTASADNVVAELENKISSLSKDPSQAGVVKKLKSIIEDIVSTGESEVPLSLGEQTKRGFNKMAGNWQDPEVGQAGKQAYQAYRGEVEGAANADDPALAEKFTQGKKTFGLLSPIQEAAERRAATLNQSPIGGLLDVATAGGAGAVVGGPVGLVTGVSAAVGRKILAPRLAASGAVTLDTISKSLLKSPQMLELYQKSPAAFQEIVNKLEQRSASAPMSLPRAADNQDDSAMNFDASKGKDAILAKTQGSKYAQVLQNAAQRGDQSLAAAHYVLANRDQDYRKLTE